MSKPLKNRPRPRVDATKVSYPIVRCNRRERFSVRCIVLSKDVFGVEVHFAGRSHVCTSHLGTCKHCEDGKPTRWVGYVAAISVDLNSRFLVELTPGVMPDLDRHLKQWKSLRGCWLGLTRPTQRDTGRLVVTVGPPFAGCTPEQLPAPFDLEQVLEKIYGVPKTAADQAETLKAMADASDRLGDRVEMDSLSCRVSTVQGDPELEGQLHLPMKNGKAAS